MSKRDAPQLHLLKKRFQEWYLNHPDVKFEANFYKADNYLTATPIRNISPLWFVINLMGDLIAWEDSPTDWIAEIEDKKSKQNRRSHTS